MHGNEQAELLVLRATIAGTLTMGKGGMVKTIFKHLLGEEARADETHWSKMNEHGIQCGSRKKGRIRG